jgi:hypothetical protein
MVTLATDTTSGEDTYSGGNSKTDINFARSLGEYAEISSCQFEVTLKAKSFSQKEMTILVIPKRRISSLA